MSFDPLSAALDLGNTLVDKIWPDPTKAAQEKLKLADLYQRGDLAELNAQVKMLTGQLDINKIEAAHPSIFVAGWRPFVGWVCGVSLVYNYLIYELLVWALIAFGEGTVSPPPRADMAQLTPLLLGMLGLGGLRSLDKKNKVDTKKTNK